MDKNPITGLLSTVCCARGMGQNGKRMIASASEFNEQWMQKEKEWYN